MTEVTIRQECTTVTDGLTMTPPYGGRLHFQYQVRVNGQIIRCRFAIPPKWETLTVEEIINEGSYEVEIYQEEIK